MPQHAATTSGLPAAELPTLSPQLVNLDPSDIVATVGHLIAPNRPGLIRG